VISRKSLFRKRPLDSELDSEIRFHIDELTAAKIGTGIAPQEARRQALAEFGGSQQTKEQTREVYRVAAIDRTLANLKLALRSIRRNPAFSITVILTLALAIGANSTVFSAIDAILLRPLPFPQGDQLVSVQQFDPKLQSSQATIAPVRLEEWNRMNSTFQAITGYYLEDDSEISGTLPEKVSLAFVAPRFLQVWGTAPVLGRDFTTEELHSGAPGAMLISDRFWRRRYAANPDALGKKIRLGGDGITIVGVMPASFLFPDRDVDMWSPIPPDSPVAQNRSSTWYVGIGRLKPGVTPAEARADLANAQAQLGKAYPQSDAQLKVGVEPLKETQVGGARKSLWLLFGSVSLLLLIACTNIAALLLARGAQREHEISIRSSLGASRTALVAQLLTEAFVLAVGGAAIGLIVAAEASRVFRMLAAELPRVQEIHLDGRIVIYALACSMFTTLLCALFPAIQGTRSSITSSLARVGPTQVSARHSWQWALVAIQVALSVTLLAGAGLLLRSFRELGRVSPGFDPSHVLTFNISASWGESSDLKGMTQRIDRTMDELRSVPGVEAVATSAALPGVLDKYEMEVKLSGGRTNPGLKIIPDSRFVSSSYFATMKIPLLDGEFCPGGSATPCVVVNRSFANTYLAGSNPPEIQVHSTSPELLKPTEIRGIVGDAREEGLNRDPVPTVYWCMSAPVPDPFYLVRTRIEPMMLAETVRQKIHEIEPARSVFNIVPLEEHLEATFAENRLRTVLLLFFALTAVSLACIGLYGSLAYSVSVRQREIGLRLALGALRGQIVKQVLIRGMAIAALGCALGLALAIAFSRLLAGMLYGVSPSDLPTLMAVSGLVLFVAVISSLVPAFRAARVEPMRVLRDQ
jgi:putative ABC transport system permease protein